MTTTLAIRKSYDLALRAAQVTGESDFADEDFDGDYDFELACVLVVKPSATILTCELIFTVDEIDFVIPVFTSDEGVTTGIYLEDRTITVPAGGILRFNSTEAVDGPKAIAVMGRRIRGGS